jgi:hypothetical protein
MTDTVSMISPTQLKDAMTTSDNIGLFDLDGSLANYDKAVLEGLAALKSPDEPVIEEVRVVNQLPHVKARMDLIMKQPNWWLNLEPIPMGFKVLDLAKEIGFQIHVLTQGPRTKPLAWKEKVEWCQKHLGADIDIHITRNKGLVTAAFCTTTSRTTCSNGSNTDPEVWGSCR